MTDLRHEAVVRRFLERLHGDDTPDLTAALEDFAEDVVYQSLVPSRAPIHGRAAVRSELEAQFGRYTDCICEIVAVASSDRHVFTERRDHVTVTGAGRRIFSSVNAVFEMDGAGRIVAWREYWDTGDIAAQLGIPPEELQRLHGVTPGEAPAPA